MRISAWRIEGDVMQTQEIFSELKKAGSKHGYELSDSSGGNLISKLNLQRFDDLTKAERDELYDFLFSALDVTHSRQLNLRGEIILHEPDADRMVDNVRNKRVALGRLRDIWCMIFIGGCP
jgi:hypothetical protein